MRDEMNRWRFGAFTGWSDIPAGPPDTINPVLTLAIAAKSGHDAYTGGVTVSEPSRVWHVHLPTATPASVATIKAGVSQWFGSAGAHNVSGSGVAPEATEYLHFYAEDAAGNPSGVIVSNLFTTDAAPDLSIATLTLPADMPNGTDGYMGGVTTDKTGGLLFHVVTQSATTPTPEQIVAGQDHTGAPASVFGSSAVSSAGYRSVMGYGLTPSTDYFLHFAHRTANLLLSNAVSGDGFRTAAPDVAPVINSATLNTVPTPPELNLTVTGASLPITVYWQVRPQASAAPDQAAMIANTGGEAGGNYSEAAVPASEGIDYSAAADGAKTLYVMVRENSGLYSTITDVDFTKTTTTAPSAFVVGNWTLTDPATNGDLLVTINALPANGGAAITDVEYQVGAGSWTSSGGTVTFTIAGLTNDASASVKIRAVNSVGSGANSDTKSETPTAPAAAAFTDNFDSSAPWTLPSGATISGGKYNLGGTIVDTPYGDYRTGAGNLIPVEAGETYEVSIVCDSVVTTSMTFESTAYYYSGNTDASGGTGQSGANTSAAISAAGTYVLHTIVTAAGTGFLQFAMEPSVNSEAVFGRLVVTKTS